MIFLALTNSSELKFQLARRMQIGHVLFCSKPCKTRQPSIEFITDRQSYSEADENNYEPCRFFKGSANGKNLHILLKRQNVMLINESYHISSFLFFFEFSITTQIHQ